VQQYIKAGHEVVTCDTVGVGLQRTLRSQVVAIKDKAGSAVDSIGSQLDRTSGYVGGRYLGQVVPTESWHEVAAQSAV
jgi:hypothetical protein